jgi:hypothetical protein
MLSVNIRVESSKEVVATRLFFVRFRRERTIPRRGGGQPLGLDRLKPGSTLGKVDRVITPDSD